MTTMRKRILLSFLCLFPISPLFAGENNGESHCTEEDYYTSGNAYLSQKEYKKAQEYHKKAIELHKKSK